MICSDPELSKEDEELGKQFKAGKLALGGEASKDYIEAERAWLKQRYTACNIRDNEWFNAGQEADIKCPPSGKEVQIKYQNGDMMSIKFFELLDMKSLQKKYKHVDPSSWEIDYPITAVEINCKIANTDIELKSNKMNIGKGSIIGGFFSYCQVGISLR